MIAIMNRKLFVVRDGWLCCILDLDFGGEILLDG
jgi:hypothetical protein